MGLRPFLRYISSRSLFRPYSSRNAHSLLYSTSTFPPFSNYERQIGFRLITHYGSHPYCTWSSLSILYYNRRHTFSLTSPVFLQGPYTDNTEYVSKTPVYHRRLSLFVYVSELFVYLYIV